MNLAYVLLSTIQARFASCLFPATQAPVLLLVIRQQRQTADLSHIGYGRTAEHHDMLYAGGAQGATMGNSQAYVLGGPPRSSISLLRLRKAAHCTICALLSLRISSTGQKSNIVQSVHGDCCTLELPSISIPWPTSLWVANGTNLTETALNPAKRL